MSAVDSRDSRRSDDRGRGARTLQPTTTTEGSTTEGHGSTRKSTAFVLSVFVQCGVLSMRILMIAPEPFFEPRGTPFSEFHRIRALVELGHTVDLVTYPFGRDV